MVVSAKEVNGTFATKLQNLATIAPSFPFPVPCACIHENALRTLSGGTLAEHGLFETVKRRLK